MAKLSDEAKKSLVSTVQEYCDSDLLRTEDAREILEICDGALKRREAEIDKELHVEWLIQ